jgi:anti-sigma-K factor RskA
MDYGRPPLSDRLAAEYVLGTLRGAARRRFQVLLGAHPALRQAAQRWQERLLPLASSVAPVAPPPHVWAGIEARLFSGAPVPRWWHALALWRGLSALATTAALALLVVATHTPPAQAPTVVLLAAQPGAAGAIPASFVVGLSADGRALVLKPLNAPALGAALSPSQALELWSVPAQGGPRSLGLVHADQATTLLLQARGALPTTAFAVSLEPAGGSPTGAPSGPVVSLGQV